MITLNGEKYGFIDRDGKEIIPPVYDSVEPFRKQKNKVTEN